jgi:tRNA G18 (ribose-2'-O)-methylase SpoU
MPLQLSHNEINFPSKKNPIILICDGVQSPANIGSLFRICDAFGVQEIIFFNTQLDINSTRLKRTARETHKKVPFRIEESCIPLLEQLKKNNSIIISLEITDNSTPLNKLPALKNKNIVLIIGNERTGVSKKLLELSTYITHINMYGENSSMNVSQATAIALYSLTKL